jgi:hypothetical protein
MPSIAKYLQKITAVGGAVLHAAPHALTGARWLALALVTLATILPVQLPAQSGGPGPGSASGGARIALVVGNSTYQHVSPLTNPVNDAADMGATLDTLGFEVNRVLDGSKGDLERAIRDFQSAASRPGTELALFYYAGHGVEHEGINYLIPVTADITDEYELMDQAVNVNRVTQAMDRGNAEFNMVVLDACRDNPFFRTRSAGSRGLAAMSGGGKGSMIVFATSPGDVAQDGDGRNSPFTRAFVQHAPTPGVEVSTLMRRINGTVQELTGGAQTSWFNASYTGEVYLSAAERLADATARTDAINEELSALEAEIVRRQEAIAAAENREERERLEAEQQRARAEEAAKRLQAEQLADLQTQAQRVLEQRRTDEAMRAQMEEQLSAQRVSLTRQAEERRAQLEELRRAGAADSDVWQQFETIANINRAITGIEERFAGTIARTVDEINRLYDARVAAVRENNPKEPWDTDAEYEELITGLTEDIEAERTGELESRRQDLRAAQASELEELRMQLARRKSQLTGSTFTLGAAATEVHVANFNAEEKRFPIQVRAADDTHAFVVPLSYTIDSRDRTVLREEYYRVFSADQSGGLAGEITYTVFELYPDIWVLQPTETRVINLLEDDTELAFTAAGTGEMVVSTADRVAQIPGIVLLETDDGRGGITLDGTEIGTSGTLYRIPDGEEPGVRRFTFSRSGRNRTVAVNVGPGVNPVARVNLSTGRVERQAYLVVAGAYQGSEITAGTTTATVRAGQDRITVGVPVRDTLTVTVDGYMEEPYSTTFRSRKGVYYINMERTDIEPVGRITVQRIDNQMEIGLFDRNGLPVPIEFHPTRGGPDIARVPEGEYLVAASREGDPYWSEIRPVAATLFQDTALEYPSLEDSVGYRLEAAQAERDAAAKQIRHRNVGRTLGWSFATVGAAGLNSRTSYLGPQGVSPESPQKSRFAAGWRRTCRVLNYEHAGTG